MKTIKIIDLFTKIARGEDVPKEIKYNHTKYIYREVTKQYYIKGCMGTYDSSLRYELTSFNRLNDEVEILEEEKKIPEKIDLYKSDDTTLKGLVATVNVMFEDTTNKINQLIDYLESKEKGE